MKNRKVRRFLSRAGVYLGALCLLLWTVMPLLWMLISSLTPTMELLTTEGPWITGNINLSRYETIFQGKRATGAMAAAGAQFMSALKNSIFSSVATVALAILFGGLAAYAFARLHIRHKNSLLLVTMFFQLVPTITLVIPLYVIARYIGAIDKTWFLVILYLSFTLPYVIWVLNGYYKTIPPDMEAAARIDGCTWFSAYRRIVLPLAKPGLVAVGALAFLICWDEFLYALVFMTSTASKTMPVAISEFSTRHGTDYGMVCAAGCIATVFPMLLTMLFQKHIVTGLTVGGVKD